MLRNYLKIAFRHLKKQRLHSILNIAGLTIGMTVSILILSYVWFERSFDRFHSKSDQIYRVIQFSRLAGKEASVGMTGHGLASALKEEFPEILHTVRLEPSYEDAVMSFGENKIDMPYDSRGQVYTDNDIFKIFDIDLTLGDSETALLDPNSIVITEEESRKYFGSENPIGKIINIHFTQGYQDDLNLKVTGVAKAMPDNSHFQFKYLTSYEHNPRKRLWPFFVPIVNTYITLPAKYPPEDLESKFPGIVRKYLASEIEKKYSTTFDDWQESGGYWRIKLQALKNVHLDKYSLDDMAWTKKGNLIHVQIYTVIALLIIVLASINFITLSTARSGTRAKEVGLRKVNGAGKQQLIWQFLTESISISFISLILAVLMVALTSRPFNTLLEIQTSHSKSGIVFIILALLAVALLIGVIAGSYPAFFLSAFKPVNVLKGQQLDKMKGMHMRNGLVIFQFVISMLLIISSLTVYKQFVFMQNKDLGFDKENVVILKNLIGAYYDDPNTSQDERQLQFASLRQDILKHPSVVTASLASAIPGLSDRHFNRDVRPEGAPPGTSIGITHTNIDYAYIDVFGLKMAAGRNFREELGIPQTMEGLIINERAAKFLDLKDPIGKYIETVEAKRITQSDGKKKWVREKVQIPIIGVFKDYNTRDLRQDSEPTIFFPQHNDSYFGFFMAVRFLPGNIPANIAFLEKTWNKMGVKEPFEYSFLDKELESQYKKEKKLLQVFSFFAILAIIIACLGIFGLAAFTAEQRTKEIGIRKAIGATIGNILKILSRIYLKLLVIATIIACPVGFIALNKWLQGFAFRINIGAGVLFFTVLITAFIVLSSVSYHSVKAAITDPARTLKYE